jgi:hypothetical protein
MVSCLAFFEGLCKDLLEKVKGLKIQANVAHLPATKGLLKNNSRGQLECSNEQG